MSDKTFTPLENISSLDNGIKIRYPTGRKLEKETKDQLADMATWIEDEFGQKVHTIFLSPNHDCPGELHAVKFTLWITKKEARRQEH